MFRSASVLLLLPGLGRAQRGVHQQEGTHLPSQRRGGGEARGGGGGDGGGGGLGALRPEGRVLEAGRAGGGAGVDAEQGLVARLPRGAGPQTWLGLRLG